MRSPCGAAFLKDLCLVQSGMSSILKMYRPVSSIIDYASNCTRTTYRVFSMVNPPKFVRSCPASSPVSMTSAAGARLSASSSMPAKRKCCSLVQPHNVQCDRKICVGGSVIDRVSVVRDLGLYVDAELTMQEHVSRTARACFPHIRRLRSVRRQLGYQETAQLVSALILSRLDYTAMQFSLVCLRRLCNVC
jgi:hypothetical protein